VKNRLNSVAAKPLGTAGVLIILAAFLALFLASCGSGTNNEVYSDAEVGDRDTAPAKVIEMPDGFSNVATKCVDGNQVYVIFRAKGTTGNFGSVAVVPGCTEDLP
jgi:hypothetical protein